MKIFFLKPGFELVFSISIIVIMTLPPIVLGQTQQKELEITIRHGDTTVNGRNIRDLSAQDRMEALKDISNLGNGLILHTDTYQNDRREQSMTFRSQGTFKRDSGRFTQDHRFAWRDTTRMMADRRRFRKDTTGRTLRFNFRRGNGRDSAFSFQYYTDRRPADRRDRESFSDGPEARRSPFGGRGASRRNSESFSYTHTGTDGITTQINFRVSEPSAEGLKRIAGVEKADLELNDLNLLPEFSSGKVLLLFNLTARVPADVKFTDNDGKLIWSEKVAGGEVKKSFALELNGIYYLEVRQAGKVAVKRIVKEE